MRDGLSFDDVLLVPKRTAVQSRKDVDTSTKLTKNISLNIPLVSANMDTVTESAMAIALARAGGIGIIHRFLTIEEQVHEVLRVKRSENIIIENPYTIPVHCTIKAAKQFMKTNQVSGLLVIDATNTLAGIVTSRDLLFEEDEQKEVHEIMTHKLVTAPLGTSLASAKEILHKNRIEKLPLIDAHNHVQGLITTKDIINQTEYPKASKDAKGKLRVGAAIGIRDDYILRAESLVSAGVDVLVVDIAHGHSDSALSVVRELKTKFPHVDIIAGNVATAQGVKELIEAGADAIKVGVGPGSVCTTRIVTGSGVPQLTAILDCASAAGNIPVIADGGIKNSGDIAKAIAAGASTVMLGGLLAGTDESPGFLVTRHGARYKLMRGMASLGANIGRKSKENKHTDLNDYVAEGVEAIVPYRGSAVEVINQLTGGFRSGMSYCGARTIAEMQKNAEFIKMTAAGMTESKPHDVNVI